MAYFLNFPSRECGWADGSTGSLGHAETGFALHVAGFAITPLCAVSRRNAWRFFLCVNSCETTLDKWPSVTSAQGHSVALFSFSWPFVSPSPCTLGSLQQSSLHPFINSPENANASPATSRACRLKHTHTQLFFSAGAHTTTRHTRIELSRQSCSDHSLAP